MDGNANNEGAGRHVDDWARAMDSKQPASAEFLYEDRANGFREVERLGLPRYVRREVNLADFLENQGVYFRNLEREKYFITLIPKQKVKRRISKWDAGREEVLHFIAENIDDRDAREYTLVIQEYFENLFGGNIIIGAEENQVYVEFKSGSPSEISDGTVVTEFFVTRDTHTGSFQYSFEDEGLRRIIYQALISIPHEGQGRDMRFLPGYYEFVIVKDDEKKVRPIYLDYKDKSVYQVAW